MKSQVKSIFVLIFTVYCIILNGVQSFPNDVVRRVVDQTTLECSPTPLSKLDATELVKAAKVSQGCSIAAADVFKAKFENQTFLISTPKQQKRPANTVQINDFEVALDTLQYFGHLISKLAIVYENEKPVCDNVQNQNSLLKSVHNCRHSLVSIDLRFLNCPVDVLGSIKIDNIGRAVQYTKVENVSLYFQGETLQTENIRFNDLFPVVRNLKLDFGQASNADFTGVYFSHLENLYYNFNHDAGDVRKAAFQRLLQSIKLKKLTIEGATREALEMTGAADLKLDELELISDIVSDWRHNDIHFKQLNKFRLRNMHECASLDNIIFDNLAEWSFINDNTDYSEECLNFIISQANVEKFEMGPLKNDDFRKLIGKFELTNVAHFDLTDVTVKSIAEFVNQSPLLKQLTFTRAKNAQFTRALKKELGQNFNIQRIENTKLYLLTRKEPEASTNPPEVTETEPSEVTVATPAPTPSQTPTVATAAPTPAPPTSAPVVTSKPDAPTTKEPGSGAGTTSPITTLSAIIVAMVFIQTLIQ